LSYLTIDTETVLPALSLYLSSFRNGVITILLAEAFVEIEAKRGKYDASIKKLKGDTEKSISGLETKWGKLSKAIDKNAESIRSLGTLMSGFGIAATAAFGLATRTAAGFQQSMANTQSVIGATSSELQKLTGFAREMGKTSVFSAKQAANAIYYLGSAGFKTNQIMKSLRGTMLLAAATQSDLAFTSETVVSTLAAYNLKAEQADRISNVFAATISGSQATMERLSVAMGYVGPVARSIGMELEETTAIMGSLFNAGIEASTAGTALRQAIAHLLAPTDKTTEALTRLGVSINKSDGSLRNFTDIIRDLETSGLSAADAMAIFGLRAGPAMLALTSKGADAIADLTKEVTGTQKAAEMAKMQTETFQGKLKLLKSAVEELQISIGNKLLPVLTDYAEKITTGINRMSEWTEKHKTLTGVLVKFGAALGGIMLGAGGLLILVPTVTKSAAAVKLLAAAFTAIPALGPIAAGLVGVGAGFTALAAGIKLYESAKGRGIKDVSGEFKRNESNMKLLRQGIEIEVKRIKELNKSIETYGTHPMWEEALDKSQKRLKAYRDELARLGGDIFGIKKQAEKVASTVGEAIKPDMSMGAADFLNLKEPLKLEMPKLSQDMIDAILPEPTSYQRGITTSLGKIIIGDISQEALAANKKLYEFGESVKAYAESIGADLKAIFVPTKKDANYYERQAKIREKALEEGLSVTGDFNSRMEALKQKDFDRTRKAREELTAIEKAELDKAESFLRKFYNWRERKCQWMLKRLTDAEKQYYREITGDQKRFRDMTFAELAKVRDIWNRAGNEIGSGWKAALIDIQNDTINWKNEAETTLGIIETAFQNAAIDILKDWTSDDFKFSWKRIWEGVVDEAIGQIGRLIGSAAWRAAIAGLDKLIDLPDWIKPESASGGGHRATADDDIYVPIAKDNIDAKDTESRPEEREEEAGLSNREKGFGSFALLTTVGTAIYLERLNAAIDKRVEDFEATSDFNKLLSDRVEAELVKQFGTGIVPPGAATELWNKVRAELLAESGAITPRVRTKLPTTMGNIRAGVTPGFEIKPMTTWADIKTRPPVLSNTVVPPAGFQTISMAPGRAGAGTGTSGPVTLNVTVNAEFPNADLRSVTQGTWDLVFNEKLVNSLESAIQANLIPRLVTS